MILLFIQQNLFSTRCMPDTILDVEDLIRNVSSGEDSYESKYYGSVIEVYAKCHKNTKERQ